MITRARAEAVLTETGWLSHQPASVQSEVLRRSILVFFAGGEAIYRFGDDPGGIFGLVAGTLSVNTSPREHAPQLIHVGAIGSWTGEGGFIVREPRRIELRALVDTWMMHLPLDQMEQMALADPSVVRNFASILMLSAETLMHVIHDLQKPVAACRIASVLVRAAGPLARAIPLTQSEIGLMANASRKQVNAALRRFSEAGWVKADYRSVTILDSDQLRRFSNSEV
ncbi:Crp/Fnr family transcriptional regulator [Enterovirga rhinocerotis]|uniref:CRP-like cAMP-binding protein n=1 Tax=Enterovirga rhinocerotis TaxID=1339210 RepID=A0A4R7BV09_9HYPH|nr:Crp/Fnr family transcriptional regulator [Enterovirga rhinocerotis]TDR89650.1 CRP-like cAMP-binding protein [Enterovirga rhinocerotis]